MNLPPSITRSVTQFRAAYRQAPKWAFWLGLVLLVIGFLLTMSWMSEMR